MDVVAKLIDREWERRKTDGEATDQQPVVVHLFCAPCVTHGDRRIDVPEGSKRLLAFAALHQSPIDRRYAARTLWPARSDGRAGGNLRSALWRLNGSGLDLIVPNKTGFRLHDEVLVDAHLAAAWADRIIEGRALPGDLDVPPWGIDALEILPGWYDDWALMERERARHRLLRAMEAMSGELSGAGRGAEAIEAAMIAIAADPLREDARLALIDAHLAEGNWIEACRAYAAYRDLLTAELKIEPAPGLAARIRPHIASVGAALCSMFPA